MANPTVDVTLTKALSPRRKTVGRSFVGETIYAGALVERRTDGKYYNLSSTYESAVFAGIAEQRGSTSIDLVITTGPDWIVKVTAAATEGAEALAARTSYSSLGCINGANDGTFVAADNGLPVYGVDGGCVTAHPWMPNQKLVGYLMLEATGDHPTGWGYIRLIGEEQAVLEGAKWHQTGLILEAEAPSELTTIDNANARTKRFVYGKKMNRVIGYATDIDAEATAAKVDPDWDLDSSSGTAVSTIHTTGASRVTTAGGANTTDTAIVTPHGGTDQSTISDHTFGTARRPRFGAIVNLPAITTVNFQLGFALTGTLNRTTDDTKFVFTYNTTADTDAVTWHVAISNDDLGGGVVDTIYNTGVAIAAATDYRLEIDVDDDKFARFYINGTLVYTHTSALVTSTALIPIYGVGQLASGTARSVDVQVLGVQEDMSAS